MASVRPLIYGLDGSPKDGLLHRLGVSPSLAQAQRRLTAPSLGEVGSCCAAGRSGTLGLMSLGASLCAVTLRALVGRRVPRYGGRCFTMAVTA